MPKLIVTKAGSSEEKNLPLGKSALIGRIPNAEVSLEGPGISREHAQILEEAGQYYLTDLESDNGTFLNGVRLSPKEKRVLRHHDQIGIEDYHLRFWEIDERFEVSLREEEEDTDADIVEVKLLKKVLDAMDQESLPSLEVLNGVTQGKRIFLTDDTEEMTLGRDPSCDFAINEFVISRNHAKIVKRWGGITLVDLESKNGTYINNRRITEEFLHDGDRLALGTIVLLFRNPKEINMEALGEEIAKQKPKPSPPPRATSKKTSPKEEDAQKGSEEEWTDGSPQETADLLKDIPPLKTAPANAYPIPTAQAEKHWTPLEIGMIGLGIVVLSFAVITLANLLFE